MCKLIPFTLFFLLYFSSSSQVNWKSAEKVSKVFSLNQRPIIVVLKTDWCKVCKMQEQMVFQDTSIYKKLNHLFYTVQLDVEKDTNQLFFGRRYAGASAHSYHELGTYLMDKESLVFPSVVVLDKRLNIVFKKEGYLSKTEFLSVIEGILSKDQQEKSIK